MPGSLIAYRALDDGRHRAEFYRMWRAGQSAGLTTPRSLEVMGPRQSPQVEMTRRWLFDGTTKGRGITDLVRAGGSRFESFERALLVLGDETGSLDQSLRLLADFYTRKHKLMLWVKKQMAYPFFTALMMCFIAPLKLLLFVSVKAYLMAVGPLLGVLLLSAGSIVTATANFYGRKPALARARFARALATAIEAGLPLAKSVRLAAEASANREMRSFVAEIREMTLGGQAISESLARCPHMTPDLLAVIETAERTGDFNVLSRIAALYEDGFR